MWTYDADTGLIKMTKGDTPSFKIGCNVIDEETGEVVPYTPLEDDVFIFAVRQDRDEGDPLFYKEIDKETMEVTFAQEDTKNLETGKYWYEVSLNSGDYHCTFIEGKRLILKSEIY